MNKAKEAEAILGNLVMALHILEDCAEFSVLIPEVRTNIAYALPDAQTPHEVAAFPGRITIFRGCNSKKLKASFFDDAPSSWVIIQQTISLSTTAHKIFSSLLCRFLQNHQC